MRNITYDRKRKNKKQQLINIPKVLLTLLIIFLALFLLHDIYQPRISRKLARRLICGTNLSGLGKALHLYEDLTGRYPDPNNWCDLLIERADIPEKALRCPADKVGPFSYAMNPDCGPNSPNDVVLLFETESGWNMSGGPELLNPNYHNGCNVLLNNGIVEFIHPEDFNDLIWQ